LTADGLAREGSEVFRVDTILHSLKGPLLPVRMLLQPLVTAARFMGCASKCDVVHIQACSWWGFLPVIVCAPLNRLFFRKRLVVTFHGARGHIFLRRHHLWAVPIAGMVDKIMVVSPELQEAFANYGITTEVVGIVINIEAFKYRERMRIKPNMVWARQLTEMYDPIATLQVFERVRSSYPDATLTMIGEGAMRPLVEQYIREKQLDGVRLLGQLPNTEMPVEFDRADIFINTSKNDAKPAALLEACAAGLPIVTTDAGGIPDILENGKEGVIVPLGDTDAFAGEVIGLIRDPERARKIGAAARRNAEKYGWPKYAVELERAYGIGA
jgi:glycosyltransferase involved in cell wall biosynthesis